MALLNVTEPLQDPDLCDAFTFYRRFETVDDTGRTVLQSNPVQAYGVITASTPNSLDRPEEYGSFTRSITVVTMFELRGAMRGTQPDIIFWRGSNYVVKSIDFYAHFGSGFYQVEAESIEMADPIIEGLSGSLSLDFSKTNNSQYVSLLC